MNILNGFFILFTNTLPAHSSAAQGTGLAGLSNSGYHNLYVDKLGLGHGEEEEEEVK